MGAVEAAGQLQGNTRSSDHARTLYVPVSTRQSSVVT
jgi:hypothetical protein